MNRVGKSTIVFDKLPRIIGNYSIVGPKEGEGNFGKYFDEILQDDTLGEKTYEKAECKLLEQCVRNAIHNAKLSPFDIDYVVSGDLMNQITSSSFAARSLNIPYVGVFGACSTMAESLAIGACLINADYAKNVVCATVSHFSSAEKQFRYPLELGTQRPPTSQWTTTGSGATVLSHAQSGIAVSHATIGRVVDWNVTDVNNMGGAMAPAAFDTLFRHLDDMGVEPDYYDLILTGDLGKLGSEVLIDLMSNKGIYLGANYSDCGQMMFKNNQKTFMGASGCGCGASILNSYVLQRLKNKDLKNVLFIATGALLSPLTCQQGESIPCVAHAVVLKGEDYV
ncbi:MAG: stage V sporulation protein AD [Clostridia bacterium]|nr:stage V sporulation protein AD [Clostridia bacterium]